MICQSQTSPYCLKRIRKEVAAHIWVEGKPLKVCSNCYWLLKQSAKKIGRGGNPTGRRGNPTGRSKTK